MDIKTTTSLQDRIKALNIGKISQLSPQKPKPTEDEQNRTSIYDTPKPRARPRKSISQNHDEVSPHLKEGNTRTGNRDKTTKIESVYNCSPSNIPVGESTNSSELFRTSPNSKTKPIVSDNAFNYMTTSNELKTTSDNEGQAHLYSDIPSNIPVNRRPTDDSAFAGETVKTIPQTNEESTDVNGQDQRDTSIYSSPRSHQTWEEDPTKQGIYTTTKQAEDISSRWQTLRKSVKDPKLRKMIDMSELQSPDFSSPTFPITSRTTFFGDVTNNPVQVKLSPEDDVTSPTSSPGYYKRSKSLADTLFPADTNESRSKRPSLPAMMENNVALEISAKFNSSPERQITQARLSHDSSSESGASTDPGRPRNLSDLSNTSLEIGRPRNVSNVSVTHEEDNYIAFGSLDDGSSDKSPNECTLVVVKGDTPHCSTMILDKLPSDTSPSKEATERQVSASEENPPEWKKGKNKKFKVFGKLTKAVKHKISSSASTSPLTTPTSKTMQPRQFPSSPGRNMTLSPKLMTSQPRSNTSSPLHKFSSNTQPPSPAPRPLSHGIFHSEPEISSSNLLDDVANEGVYYDPSAPNEDEETEDEDNDVIRIEYDVTNFNYDITPLTPNKRSRSMASLSENHFQNPGIHRKFSEDIDKLRSISEEEIRKMSEGIGTNGAEPLYMVSSSTPIPPPKPKSMRRKAEREKALMSMTSSNHDVISNASPNNGLAVKLRNTKLTQNKERQDWPGGRPPSMPVQVPPKPPRPTSMPMDKPPEPDDQIEENEYVAASYSSSVQSNETTESSSIATKTEVPKPARLPPQKPLVQEKARSMSPRVAEKPIRNQEKTEDTLQTPGDSIYYTVSDPEPEKKQENLANKVTTSVSSLRAMHNVLRNGKSNTISPNFQSETKGNQPPPRPNSTMIRKTKEHSPTSEPQPLFPKPTLTGPPRPPKPKPQEKPNLLNKSSALSGQKQFSNEKSEDKDVIPPPRPSKMNKVPPKPPRSLTAEDTVDSAMHLDQSKGDRNPTIAELGKLISGPLSPQKPIRPPTMSPKINRTDKPDVPAALMPLPSRPKPLSMADKPKMPQQASTYKQQNKRFSSTAIAPEETTSPRLRPVNPTAKLIQQRNEAISASAESGTSKATQRRPAAKKPSGPPPPRPNVPPPSRPDDPAAQKDQQGAKSTNTTGGKTAPPPRPPPPSSDKIKAAEERRKTRRSTGENPGEGSNVIEDDYNDMDFKHIEDFNPYAAIDDSPLDGVSEQLKRADEMKPSPPTRSKQGKKVKGSQSFSVIANMKYKLGKKKIHSDTRMPLTTPVITEQAIYNSGEEEGVYAGIDDFNFPPPMQTYHDVTMFSASGQNTSSNGAYMTSQMTHSDDDEFDSD